MDGNILNNEICYCTTREECKNCKYSYGFRKCNECKENIYEEIYDIVTQNKLPVCADCRINYLDKNFSELITSNWELYKNKVIKKYSPKTFKLIIDIGTIEFNDFFKLKVSAKKIFKYYKCDVEECPSIHRTYSFTISNRKGKTFCSLMCLTHYLRYKNEYFQLSLHDFAYTIYMYIQQQIKVIQKCFHKFKNHFEKNNIIVNDYLAYSIERLKIAKRLLKKDIWYYSQDIYKIIEKCIEFKKRSVLLIKHKRNYTKFYV